jgi:hypothetical protein
MWVSKPVRNMSVTSLRDTEPREVAGPAMARLTLRFSFAARSPLDRSLTETGVPLPNVLS